MSKVYVLITLYQDIIDEVDVYLDQKLAEEKYYGYLYDLYIEENPVDSLPMETVNFYDELDRWYEEFLMASSERDDEYHLYFIEPIVAKEVTQ